MAVFVFIDTNVLLQYRLFDEIHWPKELGIPQLTLVFAPVIFTELDKFKWGGTRRQKDRASAHSSAGEDARRCLTRQASPATGVRACLPLSRCSFSISRRIALRA